MSALAEHLLERAQLPELGPVLDFMRLVWQLDHALEQRSKRMAARLGVTGPQRLVIRVVGRFPGIPAGHVARLLHLHPSTLTGVFDRLARHGLLRRRRDPRDGRRLLLSLTDQGRRFDTETAGTVESAISHILAQTPPAKLQAAREVLESIAVSLLAEPPRSG